MNSQEARQRMQNEDLCTIQENRIIGSSESSQIKIANGRFWTPRVILRGDNVDIDQLNKLREEAGFFLAPSFVLAVLDKWDEEDRVGLSFEPLDESGETIRDPQVVVVNVETGDWKVEEGLTEELYAEVRKFEQEEQLRSPDKNRDLYQYFLRESPSKQESELPKPLGGMKNV